MAPDSGAMLQRCDAALIIGDPALYLEGDAETRKIDLGEEWTAMTGLPFVWAFWAGRSGTLSSEGLTALTAARDAGVAASDRIADDYCGPARAALGRAYLRENIRYCLGEREQAGLRQFYELALGHELVEVTRPLASF